MEVSKGFMLLLSFYLNHELKLLEVKIVFDFYFFSEFIVEILTSFTPLSAKSLTICNEFIVLFAD